MYELTEGVLVQQGVWRTTVHGVYFTSWRGSCKWNFQISKNPFVDNSTCIALSLACLVFHWISPSLHGCVWNFFSELGWFWRSRGVLRCSWWPVHASLVCICISFWSIKGRYHKSIGECCMSICVAILWPTQQLNTLNNASLFFVSHHIVLQVCLFFVEEFVVFAGYQLQCL